MLRNVQNISLFSLMLQDFLSPINIHKFKPESGYFNTQLGSKINFYDGNGRFMGDNLIAKSIDVYHRGTNDIIVKPIERIVGKMVSTGNVILRNTPPIVAVEQLYQGRVVYN